MRTVGCVFSQSSWGWRHAPILCIITVVWTGHTRPTKAGEHLSGRRKPLVNILSFLCRAVQQSGVAQGLDRRVKGVFGLLCVCAL